MRFNRVVLAAISFACIHCHWGVKGWWVGGSVVGAKGKGTDEKAVTRRSWCGFSPS